MEDNRKDQYEYNSGNNSKPGNAGNGSISAEQPSQQSHMTQDIAGLDISEMDMQEGHMSNGTLGGNFDAKEIEMDYTRDSPTH